MRNERSIPAGGMSYEGSENCHNPCAVLEMATYQTQNVTATNVYTIYG